MTHLTPQNTELAEALEAALKDPIVIECYPDEENVFVKNEIIQAARAHLATLRDEKGVEEMAAFEKYFKGYGLDFSRTEDSWGKPIYKHTHIDAMYAGWCAAQGYLNGVPDGYALVPIEPTEEMWEAGYSAGDGETCARAIYKAMIEAAPKKEGE